MAALSDLARACLSADGGTEAAVAGQQFQHGLIVGRLGEMVSLGHLAIELLKQVDMGLCFRPFSDDL